MWTAAPGHDTVVVDGTQNNDVFTVTATSVTLNGQRPINETGVENLTLRGLNGDDTFNIPGGHGYTTINIEGGSPSASDVLFLTGTPGAVADSVIIAPDAANPTEQDVTGLGGTINVSGVELMRYTGVGGPVNDTLTVRTGNLNDTARVSGSATGINLDEVTSSSLPTIQYTGLSTFVLDVFIGLDSATFNTGTLVGALPANYQVITSAGDELIIEGFNSGVLVNDVFTVTNPTGASTVAVTHNNADAGAVTVTNTNAAGPGLLRVNGLGGNDSVTVNIGVDGLIATPIVFDGGAGRDTLIVTGTLPVGALSTVAYTPGPDISAGRLNYNSGGMTIEFTNLEPVIDTTVATTLTVNGTNGDNAINYRVGRNDADTADDTRAAGSASMASRRSTSRTRRT